MRQLTIAVDGPGSSGKGSVARELARALGYRYLDTGAMYRSVALVARRQGIDTDDAVALGALARDLGIDFAWDGERSRVQLDGEDVTRALRADDIGSAASAVSRHPQVRSALLTLQRALADRGGIVMDGRDIGTVVLPDADLKIYLDATLDERARRRHEELVRRGEGASLAEVRAALAERDRADTERPVAPLRQADDAVLIDSTHLTIQQAVSAVLVLVAPRVRPDSGVDSS